MQNEQPAPTVFQQDGPPQQFDQQPAQSPKHHAKRYLVAGLAATVLAIAASYGAYAYAQRHKTPAPVQQTGSATENDSQFDTDDIDLPPAENSTTIDAPAVEEHHAGSDTEQHTNNHQ